MWSSSQRACATSFLAFLAFLCSRADADLEVERPIVFWASQPALPGETVYLQGHLLEAGSVVEVAELAGEPGPVPGGVSAEATYRQLRFRPIAAIEPVSTSLKFALPEDDTDPDHQTHRVYAYRVRNEQGSSAVHRLNDPRVWWVQGSGGFRKGIAGEWLRVNGSCLDFEAGTRAALVPAGSDGRPLALEYVTGTVYSAEFLLPGRLEPGDYSLYLHNGLGGPGAWSEAAAVEIVRPPWREKVFALGDYAEDLSIEGRTYSPGIVYTQNEGNETDRSFARAIAAAAGDGGGVVLVPKGHYQMNQTLVLPPGVILKGEHRDLVTLDWGDRPVALPALIQGVRRFGVEDLSIVAGNHRDGIAVEGRQKPGRGDVRIRRVLIKLDRMSPVTRRNFTEDEIKENYQKRLWIDRSGALRLSGDNIEVSNCDIMTVPSVKNAAAIYLERARGAYISGNKVLSSFRTSIYIKGCENVVFTDNEITGGFFIGTHHTVVFANEDDPVEPAADGTFVEQPFLRTDMDKNVYLNPFVRNVYISRNKVRHALLEDSEITTLDSHYPQGIYFGKIEKAEGSQVILAGDTMHPQIFGEHWEDLNYWASAAIYILDGKGAGQYRRIEPGSQGRVINIDRPWDVAPDGTSQVSIAKLHERLIFEGNDYMDGGVFQLWGGSLECVVNDNTFTRTGHITSRSGHIYNGLMPDWYSQFVGNTINQAGAIGTSTYPYEEDGIVYGHDVRAPGKERVPHPASRRDGAPDENYRENWTYERVYSGPIARGTIYRRNLHRIGSLYLGGGVDGAVVENNRAVSFSLEQSSGLRSPVHVFAQGNEQD